MSSTRTELAHKGQKYNDAWCVNYVEYIKRIKDSGDTNIIEAKIADLKFLLAQPDAKSRKKYDTYIKALAILQNTEDK